MRFATFLFATFFVATASPALAAPILVTQAAFDSSETLITFNALGNEVPIANQFAAQGVTFSGPVWSMTNGGDLIQFPSNGGGVIASNYRYSNLVVPGSAIDITFSTDVTRVGFFQETNAGDDLLVTVFRDGVITGSFAIDNPNGVLADFFGVSDLLGIDRILIDAQVNVNRFVGFDDLRFGGTVAPAAVPEPGTLLLLGSGAAGLLARRKRRQSRS